MKKNCEECLFSAECGRFYDLEIDLFDDETEESGQVIFKYRDVPETVSVPCGYSDVVHYRHEIQRKITIYKCYDIPEEDEVHLRIALRAITTLTESESDNIEIENVK